MLHYFSCKEHFPISNIGLFRAFSFISSDPGIWLMWGGELLGHHSNHIYIIFGYYLVIKKGGSMGNSRLFSKFIKPNRGQYDAHKTHLYLFVFSNVFPMFSFCYTQSVVFPNCGLYYRFQIINLFLQVITQTSAKYRLGQN